MSKRVTMEMHKAATGGWKVARISLAAKAKTFETGSALLAEAKDRGEMVYGWVKGRFYQMYPGGRCIDWTLSMREEDRP